MWWFLCVHGLRCRGGARAQPSRGGGWAQDAALGVLLLPPFGGRVDDQFWSVGSPSQCMNSSVPSDSVCTPPVTSHLPPQVHAPPGPTRTEVMQIAEIFRAHAVDTSERTLTLQTTGDVGKVRAAGWGLWCRAAFGRGAAAALASRRVCARPSTHAGMMDAGSSHACICQSATTEPARLRPPVLLPILRRSRRSRRACPSLA